jgi:hypothetical protein
MHVQMMFQNFRRMIMDQDNKGQPQQGGGQNKPDQQQGQQPGQNPGQQQTQQPAQKPGQGASKT